MHKPIKPENLVKEINISVEEWSLQKIIDHFTGLDLDFNKINIERDCWSERILARYSKYPYTDKEFAILSNKYKKDLQAYEDWYNSEEEGFKRRAERQKEFIEEKKKKLIVDKSRLLVLERYIKQTEEFLKKNE